MYHPLLCYLLILFIICHTVKPMCIDKCICMNSGLQVNCSGGTFKHVPITFNPRLREFNISHNELSNLGVSRPFDVYSMLQNLDLSYNKLQEIPMNTFQNQKQLRVLDLSFNSISLLTEESFKGLQSLQVLHLMNNQLKNVSSMVFSHLSTLKLLNLSSNSLENLSFNAFANLSKLTHLSLRDNKLGSQMTQLPTESSQGSSSSINVAGGDGNDDYLTSDQRVPSQLVQLFEQNGRVFHLSLSALDVIYLPNVQFIDLSHNRFEVILRSQSPFSLKNKIKSHHIQQQPSQVTPSASASSSSSSSSKSFATASASSSPLLVSVVDATTGQTATLRGTWSQLKELSLDGCAIEFLQDGSLDGLISLSILRLNDNSLKEVPTEALRQVPSLTQLQLGQNLIISIEEDAFPLPSLRMLDLSHSPKLEKVKSNAFRNTWSLEHLDLSHNPKLIHLESQSFAGLNQLQTLDMSYCRLQYLNPDAFGDLKSLVTLNVRSNALTMIDSKIGSFVVNLQVLDVRDNPLACNCSIDWVRGHLSRQGNHSSSSSPSSFSPGSPFSSSSSPSSSSSSLSFSTSSPSSAALESSTTANAATTTAFLLTSNYNSKSSNKLQQPTAEVGTEVGSSSSSSSASASSSLPSSASFYLGQVEQQQHFGSSGSSGGSSILYSTSPTEEQLLLWSSALLDVKCFSPANLQGKRLIDLDTESIGCFKATESMKPIVIIALAIGIALGIFIIIIIRFRFNLLTLLRRKHKKSAKRPHDFMSSHPSFLPSPITVSSKLNPTTVTTLHINNNRKVYGFDPILGHTLHSSTNRPYLGSSASTLGRISFDELGPLCAKPEFIYVHNNTMVNTGIGNSGLLANGKSCQRSSKTQLALSRSLLNGSSVTSGGGGGKVHTGDHHLSSHQFGHANQQHGHHQVNHHQYHQLQHQGQHQYHQLGNGVTGGERGHLESSSSLEQTIYPPRHAINNLNNPYEVVPIVPQFAPPSAFQSPWPDGNRTHSPFVDSYSDQLYEEANCPLTTTSNVKIPSTEL